MQNRAVVVRTELEADPRWQLIQRIVGSPSFERASRLSDFLLFISEKTLEGHCAELNEQEIGVKVFGRRADYSRSDDNIVRANASRVRQKLDEYFATTGQSEHLRVALPKGRYVPEFQNVDSAANPEAVADLDGRTHLIQSDVGPDGTSSRRRWLSVWVFALVLLTGINLWILDRNYRLRRPGVQGQVSNTAIQLNKFWDLLFVPDQDTLIVPGDAGLNMYTNIDRRLVGLEEYRSGSYLKTPAAAPPPGFRGGGFAGRPYVSMADLELVNRLTHLPAAASSRVGLRFARDLRLDDLKSGNVILLGSQSYNPWVTLFDQNLDFKVGYNAQNNTNIITNKAPKPGEQSMYIRAEDDPLTSRISYTLIALTDNLQNSGKVLLIEGTTSAGILSATDALFNPKLMGPILAMATRQNGKLSNFEVLLKTTSYSGETLEAHVVAEHLH